MNHWMAALQPLLVGAVLLWSGGFKLFGRTAPLAAAQSALHTLLGERWALPAFRAVGFAEVAVAAGLLLPPSWPLPAAALSVGFLGYLAYARVAAPQSSCGCTSARRSPVGLRHFANAGFVLVASLMAIPASGFWADAISAQPLPATALLLAETLVVIGLNAQFDRYWLMPLRRLKVRLTHPLAAASTGEIPLHSTVQQLQRSDAYKQVGRLLRSDVVESWDEGEWRLVRYTMRYQDRPASAVFAVPKLEDKPDLVRVAVVDETDDSVLFTYAAQAPAQVSA